MGRAVSPSLDVVAAAVEGAKTLRIIASRGAAVIGAGGEEKGKRCCGKEKPTRLHGPQYVKSAAVGKA